MTDHRGSCLCGSVRFAVQGDFDQFYVCHCRHCQKDTGTAYAANLFAHSAELNWTAGEASVTCYTLPETRHRKSFCRQCGSALPSTQDGDLLVVPAGCLDTEITKTPAAHIFVGSRAKWESGLEAIPEHEGLPEYALLQSLMDLLAWILYTRSIKDLLGGPYHDITP